ncbi:MAG TPA: hypothetical protein VJY62_17195 [Bacteroidia bacterium]|nr:hypothetical protein [Bacteroidia bacterium]
MNFEIVTEKPWWFILFCFALGFLYALVLYRKENLLHDVRPWLKKLMAAFRFIVVSFLAFLLLSPLIRTVFREVEKPIIIVAQDNSQSVLTGTDSAAFRKSYTAAFNQMSDELKKNYDVRTFSFGDKVQDKISFDFSEKQTDISKLFRELSLKFANRNVGAVILASDGLYNTGSNPLYSNEQLKAPVYSIALGDTTVKKDILISRVNHNRVAFLGNTFPLEVIIDAKQCSGEKAELTVEKDSAVLFHKTIEVSGNKYHSSVPVFIEARVKGIQHYKIKISPLQNEISFSNNIADVFIDVTESKQKVLIIADAPHPDIAAMKAIIENNQNYEVKQEPVKDFKGNLNEYNLVILHQLPSVNNNAEAVLEQLKASDVSVFYILGAQTNVNTLNDLNTGITISESRNKLNEAQASPAKDFSLFTVSDDLADFISTLPPLESPFGIYRSNANIYTLLYQQIGNVKTDQPLLFFSQAGSKKIAVLAGEGIWKWRLKEFAQNNNSNFTNDLLIKMVQYLSVKEKKTPFRVSYKNNFAENEPLIFDAELYNETGELVNTPDVKMTITDAEKKSYPFTFSKTDKAWSLNAGNLPVGNYKFKAETKLGDKLYAESGEFSISALQLESSETVANHQLLFTLSEKSGGKMVYESQLNELPKMIAAREDVKPVTYTQKKLKDIINLKWVFFLIMTFLSAEWFLRKRSGAY